jgi:decaprenylphospho-beta-D-erythro-pentofuranosid-2-ulose 2-reductase
MPAVPQRVVVFGATSVIAAEAAAIYAGRGARLHLVGRSAEKLEGVAARCRREGARTTRTMRTMRTIDVSTQAADFARLDGNASVVASAIAALGGVDIALVAHGDLGDQLASERAFEDAEPILRVNFTSVVSLLVPLANHLEAARAGRIGVITSVAGERGRPRNYTYGAAKGALNVYLQGLRTRLYGSGVTVTTLKLGPVDTPMTHGHTKHPLFGKPAGVAKSIVRAIDAGRPEAYVPPIWAAIMPIIKRIPEGVFQRLAFLSGR